MLSFHVKFVQTDRRTDKRTDGRTDGQTDNGKTLGPPIFRYGGIIMLKELNRQTNSKRFGFFFFFPTEKNPTKIYKRRTTK